MLNICNDKRIELGTNDAYLVQIEINSQLIVYQGLAYRKPDEPSCYIVINDIIQDYLKNDLPRFPSASANSVTAENYRVFVQVFANQQEVYSAIFYYNWAYDNISVEQTIQCHPISLEVGNNQDIPFLGVGLNQITARFLDYTGIAIYEKVISNEQGEYCWNGRIPVDDLGIKGEVGWVKEIVVDELGLSWQNVGCDYHYALYYLSPWGNWDTLLIKGAVIETDKVARSEFKKAYNNNYISQRGRRNYLNDITKTWELHTGLLKDSAGEKMHYLINSVDVYLVDLRNKERKIPVIITDSQCKYKNYRNEGLRMVEYTINVEFAQDLIRR